MSVQTSYNFSTPRGIPGGLYDLTPYVIDTRLNESAAGKMLFGMGVVKGTTPGVNIAVPATGAAAKDFEGITVNGFTQQHDLEGVISLAKNQSVGVIHNGRIWARVIDGQAPAYGDALYLVTDGDNAGLFTTAADTTSTKIAVGGRYIGSITGGTAPVELLPASN